MNHLRHTKNKHLNIQTKQTINNTQTSFKGK